MRVLWWTPVQWQAIGTIILVVITTIYVLLTRRIASSSERAAKAAEKSATSAETATAAMRHSVAVAEAALPIRFSALYYELDDNEPLLEIICRGARVYVHGVSVVMGHLARASGRGRPFLARELLAWGRETEGPWLLHEGANKTFAAPFDRPIAPADQLWFLLQVEYSVLPDGERFRAPLHLAVTKNASGETSSTSEL